MYWMSAAPVCEAWMAVNMRIYLLCSFVYSPVNVSFESMHDLSHPLRRRFAASSRRTGAPQRWTDSVRTTELRGYGHGLRTYHNPHTSFSAPVYCELQVLSSRPQKNTALACGVSRINGVQVKYSCFAPTLPALSWNPQCSWRHLCRGRRGADA